jgi:soluble lytic murein transglycosylase-like protein
MKNFILGLGTGVIALALIIYSQSTAEAKTTNSTSTRTINIDMTEIDKISETAALAHRMNVVRETIYATAPFYGVDPETALYIADCESDFNPHAKNSSSTAKGVFQFTDTTWKYIKAPGHQFDYKENIKQFMIWYPVHPEWWQCNA